jgi:Rrf2 family protein
MAHVSAGVEYALHCLVYLVDAQDLDQPSSARDLADLQQVSTDFVAKLFTKLQKAGIVAAREGIGGGFVLARPAADITILEVVEAIDGRKALFECKGIRSQCALFGDHVPAWAVDGVCSIHAVMLEAEQQTRKSLAAQTLATVARRVAMKAPSDHSDQVKQWLSARTPRRGRRTQAS